MSGTAVMARKQASRHEDWLTALATVEERIPYRAYAARRDAAIADVRANKPARTAFAWSGGKDSQAVRVIAEGAGIGECMLAICDLEYPDFLTWVTSEMPPLLTVEYLDRDVRWLQGHPDMLFPQTAAAAARWFKNVQHAGQERYYRQYKLDTIILGRRRQDGNFVGHDGRNQYTTKGITRWSPIADWTHDEVLACLHYEGLPLPPCYHWPRGFRVGSGPWPARQWCRDEAHGWDEIWIIDRTIVLDMAPHFPGAAACIERHQ